MRIAAAVLLSLFAIPLAAATLEVSKDPLPRIARVAPKPKLKLVNVWATWCVPCVAEMPDIRRIDQAFGPELAIVGISLDDALPGDRAASKQRVNRFLDKNGITFLNLYYTGNLDRLGESLRFDGEIPITLLYDANGKELWRHQGRINVNETIGAIHQQLRRTR